MALAGTTGATALCGDPFKLFCFFQAEQSEFTVQEEESQTVTISGTGEKWKFLTLSEDLDLNVNLTPINDTHATLLVSEKHSLPGNYRFDIVVCELEENSSDPFGYLGLKLKYESNLTDKGINQTWCQDQANAGYIAGVNINKNKLPINETIELSDELFNFRVYVGTGTVTIEGSSENSYFRIVPIGGIIWINNVTGYSLVVTAAVADNLGIYNTSDAGASWSLLQALDDAPAGTPLKATWWYDRWTSGDDGELIHISWINVTLDGSYYVSFNTTSNTLGTKEIVFDGDTSAISNIRFSFLSITKSLSGNLYLFTKIDNAREDAFHVKSSNGGAWGEQANPIDEDNDQLIIVPANTDDPNDIWGLHHNEEVGNMTFVTFDNSSNVWIRQVLNSTTTNSQANLMSFSVATRHSDNHSIFAFWSNTDGGTVDVQLHIFEINDTQNITQRATLHTGTGFEYAGASLFIDQQTDNIYLTYLNGTELLGNDGRVKFINSSDGGQTWSSPVELDMGDDFRSTLGGISVGNDGGWYMPQYHNDDANDILVELAFAVHIPPFVEAPDEEPFQITIEMVPAANITVNQTIFFTMNATITCELADCGDLNLTLDPFKQYIENLTDVPEDSEFDEDTTGQTGFETNLVADVIDGTGELLMIKFDISNLTTGDTVDEATLCLFVAAAGAGSTEVFHNTNQTWIQEDIDAFCSDGVFCQDLVDMNYFTTSLNTTTTFTTSGVYECIRGLESGVQTDVTAGNNFVSFTLNKTSSTSTPTIFDSKEHADATHHPYLNLTWTDADDAKGAIPEDSGTPFYVVTPPNNPMNCTAMVEDQTCSINWTVNATGTVDTTWEFFVEVDNATVEDINISNRINVTIGVAPTPPAADTCTYTSGDWIVDCSDDCVISSQVDVGGNNIEISGEGHFTMLADIINIANIIIRGDGPTNRCDVICSGGCFSP